MPKNKGKGGKNRRRGKNENEEKRELIFKEDGQEYAQVRVFLLSLPRARARAPLFRQRQAGVHPPSPNANNNPKRHPPSKPQPPTAQKVTRMLGNGRLEAQCIDGVKRMCHIRGKMRKKVWVNAGDIVLVGLREFQDAKADVILKYMADEARSLKQYGELPENIRVNDADAMMEGEEMENAEFFDFDDIAEI
jgi:translation initiation factor 1A